MVEWLRWKKRRTRRHAPKDGLQYYVTKPVIDFTVRVLQEYGSKIPGSEGIVYWAGRQEGNKWFIFSAVAPAVEASRYGFQTSREANAQFVEFLSERDLLYVCQVHSHPSMWVDHSIVDDQETAFRSEGLLSLVVPSFCQNGILPFHRCGIHLFTKSRFQRVSDRYIKTHFHLTQEIKTFPTILKDFRNE